MLECPAVEFKYLTVLSALRANKNVVHFATNLCEFLWRDIFIVIC